MKTKLFFILLIPFLTFSQTQIGQDIDGMTQYDGSGETVVLSADGNVVAIAALFNQDNGEATGQVRVFENQSEVWTQVGQTINGDSAYDVLGTSISLSSDGTVLAIGAPSLLVTAPGYTRIYRNENLSGSWTQVGSDFVGEANGNDLGTSVSLSSDGTVVAISAISVDDNVFGDEVGQVRVYQNIGFTESWIQIGNDIHGENDQEYIGSSVSLSSDGTIVAIGAPNTFEGTVRIYQNENLTGSWIKLGADINGESFGDLSGSSVSLSSNGTIIAIGAPFNYGSNGGSGHVRVYEYQTNSWSQIGQDINGEQGSSFSGESVSLSSDGTIVAIGEYFNDGSSGIDSGSTRIYQNQSSTWVQIGSDIDGENTEDQSGKSVSLSADGTKVAIGAPFNSGVNGQDSGHVRVFNLSNLLSTDNFTASQFNIYPIPTTDIINVKFKSPTAYSSEALLYDMQGKLIHKVIIEAGSSTAKIPIKYEANGMYMLHINIKTSTQTYKIIKTN